MLLNNGAFQKQTQYFYYDCMSLTECNGYPITYLAVIQYVVHMMPARVSLENYQDFTCKLNFLNSLHMS